MAPPPVARTKIEALGIDAIITQIASGRSQTEIAKDLGVSVMSLNVWLRSDAVRSARVDEAMPASAESWLDRGLDALLNAPSDNAEIQRARAIEQHCKHPPTPMFDCTSSSF